MVEPMDEMDGFGFGFASGGGDVVERPSIDLSIEPFRVEEAVVPSEV